MAATEERTDHSPLFVRLPPGPQRLDRATVKRNQRVRICGAMVAAVADQGYTAATISRIAGLAGVSRRAFYEQFPNKDACLDAVLDELGGELRRRLINGAEAGRGVELRICGALEAAAALFGERRGLLDLFFAATSATSSSRARSRALVEDIGKIAAWIAADAGALRPLLWRGIVHGSAAALHSSLRDPGGDLGAVTTGLGAWILALHAHTPPARGEQVAEATGQASLGQAGEHERIMLAALHAAVAADLDARSALAIADHARVEPERVLELYPDLELCFEAAREMLRGEILATLRAAGGPGCEYGLRCSLGALIDYLSSPRGRDSRALDGGAEHARREFRNELAAALTAAGGLAPPPEPLREALAVAVWSIVHSRSCRSPEHRPLAMDQLGQLILATAQLTGPDAIPARPSEVGVCA